MVGGALLMGRKKKVVVEEMPFAPVPVADWILYHEKEIRAAVCDTRAELTLLGASNIDGAAHGGKISDRTAAAACKLAGELPCVVLDNGATVKDPEKWLSVLDAVRDKANGCNQPSWIYTVWSACFGKDSRPCLVDSQIIEYWDGIKRWLRYEVLFGAREKELVSFSDADIHESIAAAG